MARVNQRETLLFVHVPKTAGTTLRVLMLRQYLGQEVFVIGHSIQAGRRQLRAMDEQGKWRLRVVYGHMCWGWHQDLAPGQPHAYITMLRDPVERVLSLWAHVQVPSHYLQPAVKKMDLVGFLRSGVSCTADNGMVRQLCGRDEFRQEPWQDMAIPHGGVTRADLEQAKANLAACAVVGVAERFAEFVATMNQRYAWRAHSWQNENITRWPRLKQADLSTTMRAAVEEATALDRELYEVALERVKGQT
jgi:hypothetical protein